MTDLQTIGSDELAAVHGGDLNWQSIGQSVLGGLFNSLTQGMSSGQGAPSGQAAPSGLNFDAIFKNMFSSGLSAFTKGLGQPTGGGPSQ